MNLRHLPAASLELEAHLGAPLAVLLAELSAPQRILVIDGADAVSEGSETVFRYLADAARQADVTVIAVDARILGKMVALVRPATARPGHGRGRAGGAQARSGEAKGGCPLGSLTGQLAETDPHARALLADGFGQWQAAIGEGLRRLHQAGQLPDGTDPDALAVTLLATLQGGLLLAQVQRDARPLETAVDTLLRLAGSSRPDVPAGSGVPAGCHEAPTFGRPDRQLPR